MILFTKYLKRCQTFSKLLIFERLVVQDLAIILKKIPMILFILEKFFNALENLIGCSKY